MPLPYSLFQPLRYTQKDKQYLEARKKEYSDYDAQADAYNKLVEAYNTGPQTEEFTAVAPVAPTATEADIQNYQKEAANRARSAAGQRQTAIIAAVNPEKYNLAGFAFADGGLVDVDSLSVASFAVGGPVGEMSSAQPIAFDGPLSMADGGLVDINSLSVAAFAEGGEAGEQYESLEDVLADVPLQDEEQKEWEQEIPVRDLTRQLNETVDRYRAGRASEADLRQFFPNYSDYDIANAFGMTDAGQSAQRPESLVQPFLNSQSYNRAADRARMEDYQVERDIRQKSPNIYPNNRDAKLQLQELAEGGEVKEEAAYTEQEIDRMRAAITQSQADKGSKSPTQQAVKRIIPKSTAQGPQQKSSLARQQLYALPPYPLDMTGKLGQAGPIKRADGSPEYGEVADQELVKQIGIFEAGVPGYKQNIIKRPRIEQEGKLQIIPRSIQEEPANAFVVQKDPRVVTFDEDVAETVPYVAAHEFEHQLEGLANKRYYGNENTKTNIEKTKNNIKWFIGAQTNFLRENLEKAGVNNDKAINQIKSGLASQEVKNHLAKKLNLGKDQYFGRIGYQDQPLFEYLADLSGIETHYGIDLTRDPVIRKKVFGDDDRIIQAYKSVTGLRQQRLDAKDLPPYTYQAPAGKMDSLYNLLKDSTTRFIKRANGSPEYGEIAEQMTVGTPLPTDQGPSLASQGLNLLKQAGQTVYGNLREAVTDPVAFNKRALGNVAQQLQSDPQEFIMNWTGGGLGGIIRPKGGGNLLAGDVEKAIEPLRPKTAGGQEPGKALEELDELFKKLDDLLLKPDAAQRISRRIEESREITKPIAALDDWITSKFSNYVKKQMGTEDDPVRKLADEMSAKVQADYQAGLKRIAKMKDDIAKAKAKGKGTEASEAALADEIEKVDEAFQSTSMLPSQLGPYTHVNASIGRAREKAGMSPFETAKSSLGKSYEELADAPFAPTTKKEIDARIKTAETMGGSWAPDAPKLAENPWLAKLGEEDLVYRIRPLEINEKEIFIHTIDELRNALNPSSGLPPNLLLKPEDMQGLGIEKAFRHVNNINDWRAQQRVAANLAEAQRSATTIKEYPDTPKKLKWQQLKPAEYTELPPGYSLSSSFEGPTLFGPDGKRITTFYGDQDQTMSEALEFLSKNDLEKALKYEGSTMRHCVGGYCDDVWSGQTNIFSLRDKKGEPHVTIETAPADIRRDGNTPLDFILENPSMADQIGGIKKGRTETLSVETSRNIIRMPEFQEWLRTRPSEILQIKGKGNGKPKEEYIPFIQDFINSQQWSHIGDIQNADFVPLKLSMMDSLRKKGIKVDISFSDANAQPYITKQEFNRLADELGGVNKYD